MVTEIVEMKGDAAYVHDRGDDRGHDDDYCSDNDEQSRSWWRWSPPQKTNDDNDKLR